ncbi:Cyclin-dependent kinase 12 [Fusarium oxysporum f. sp. raphani]|uniref:Cyclin-dependent kinase 12 n=1 Tax=Fusarium oxysporum f. sp. raphani TaxID=96318 RepID=A0A8J5Q843_FUSOX|nr:Cyclin-dependent kinase 12 [Fusarium oxysporum f. sp. raphani]
MSKLDRHTLLIDDEVAAFLKSVKTRQTVDIEAAGTLPRKKIPVKKTDSSSPKPGLVPVLAGSPWKHYTQEYFIEYWCLFAIATSKTSRENLHMIRSAPALNDEKLQIIRQICHPNVVETMEVYSHDDGNHYIVSRMMESSLMHVCRAPEYPSESQLSSILFQVLSGAEYLISKGLVPESITCAGVLINLAGEVKISNIEEFQPGGKGPEAKIGLSNLDRWSPEAVNMLSLLDSGPSMEELAKHGFWKKGRKEDLKSLAYFTLITAYHRRS